MGLFGASSPFDADIEKATSEKNTTEQWGVIMDICDKVGSSSTNAKDCLKSIMKRLSHNDPHVVIQAITLLDACVNNCGKNFHLEVASRDFENEYRRIVSKNQSPVTGKLVGLLKKWSEGEFKTDPQLNLIPSFYQKLKSEGLESIEPVEKPKVQATFSKDPNVVQSQQEMDDIAKAIELSLKENKNASPKASGALTASSSAALYPSIGGGASSYAAATSHAPEPRKVRALYDFEAAEDNELTFQVGEIIHVLDDSDLNWWKGYNQRGEGLFPSNFVTADLSVEPESMRLDKAKKSVQFAEEDSSRDDEEDKIEPVEINEQKIDRLLHLLHEANPEDPTQDTPEMLALELQVNQMGPLIDAELERVDRKHAQLTQLSSDLVEAINLYHTLMREPEKPMYMNPALSQAPPVS
ncbi:signal transducing adapter molecule 1 [Sergentomyia squamirostris]